MDKILIPIERIEKVIYMIRGEKVMLDRDLATLYGVSTKALKQAVKRNIARFPTDFMFVLNTAEFQNWRSQFVTSNADRRGLRHPPMAFTEHGIRPGRHHSVPTSYFQVRKGDPLTNP